VECREKEVLAEVPLAEREERAPQAALRCRVCRASNPPGRRFCEECGALLVPRRRRALLAGLGVVAVAGAVAIALVAIPWRGRPERPPARAEMPPAGVARPPEPQPPAPAVAPPAKPARSRFAGRVREETRELLKLLAAKDYERIIDNYCQPDDAGFRRVQRALDEIVRGESSTDFARWTVFLIRSGEAETVERLRRAGDPHPEFAAALLSCLIRDPDASGRHRRAEDRARDVLRWHIAGFFEGIELAKVAIRDVKEERSEGFVTTLECGRQPPGAGPEGTSRRIRWCKLPVGWVIKLTLGERIERVRQTLKQPIPDRAAPRRVKRSSP